MIMSMAMSERTYPPLPRGDDADDYHGELIADPYRGLEDTDAPATAAWIGAQNELTEAFLAGVPTRGAIRARLTELWDYSRSGVPFERGGRWFALRADGLRNQPVVCVMDAPGAEGRALIDPNLLAEDGTVAVTGLAASEDGSLLAYATSAAGSDWRTWRVRDVATGADTGDVIEWQKFYSVAWRKDGSGFYYSGMDRPAPHAEYRQESRTPRIMFHRLGTAQAEDELVFAEPGEPDWLPEPAVSDDGRYLIVRIHRGTFPETQIRVLDLHCPGTGFQPLARDFACQSSVITNVGATFYLLTDSRAGRRRVVTARLGTPDGRWQEVIPELAETLLDARYYGGRLVCHYLRDACSLLRVYQLDGTPVRDIPVPAMASLDGGFRHHEVIQGRPGSDTVIFGTAGFAESGALWCHDLRTSATRQLRRSSARIEPGGFVTEQVLVHSGDGTPIPVFLTRRGDVVPTGEVPVLLYGYGGFDVSLTPSFAVPQVVWMERGGLLAVANLRGGGEYGRDWHDAGRLASKQNVFDDFCACARWLSSSGWSRPGRIAIYGGSNGGLLVGACLTQHPELFGAAAASVGVFDMLRFHRFTIGWAWVSDFGSPDDPEQYRKLRAYSPLHNVQAGRSYPATLLLTGDHDDRVVPGHSLKFAATLQAAQAGDAPILLRVETAAGHGEGKPTVKQIAEQTDLLTFLEAVLGVADSGPSAGRPGRLRRRPSPSGRRAQAGPARLGLGGPARPRSGWAGPARPARARSEHRGPGTGVAGRAGEVVPHAIG